MVFCPCVDGLSHNEDEEIFPEWASGGRGRAVPRGGGDGGDRELISGMRAAFSPLLEKLSAKPRDEGSKTPRFEPGVRSEISAPYVRPLISLLRGQLLPQGEKLGDPASFEALDAPASDRGVDRCPNSSKAARSSPPTSPSRPTSSIEHGKIAAIGENLMRRRPCPRRLRLLRHAGRHRPAHASRNALHGHASADEISPPARARRFPAARR